MRRNKLKFCSRNSLIWEIGIEVGIFTNGDLEEVFKYILL